MRLSMRKRILLAFLAFIVGPGLIAFVAAQRLASSFIQSRVLLYTSQLTDQITRSIDSHLVNYQTFTLQLYFNSELSAAASAPSAREGELEEVARAFLQGFVNSDRYVSTAYLMAVDPETSEYGVSSAIVEGMPYVGVDAFLREHKERIQDSRGRLTWLPTRELQSVFGARYHCFGAVRPVRQEGEIVALLLLLFREDFFRERYRDVRLDSDETNYLVARDGTIVSSSNEARTGTPIDQTTSRRMSSAGTTQSSPWSSGNTADTVLLLPPKLPLHPQARLQTPLSVYPPAEAVSATDNAGGTAAGGAVAARRGRLPRRTLSCTVLSVENGSTPGRFKASSPAQTGNSPRSTTCPSAPWPCAWRTPSWTVPDSSRRCGSAIPAIAPSWRTRCSGATSWDATPSRPPRLRSALPESHVPSGVPLVLTAWSLLWMIACEEYVLHSGDTEFVTEIAPWLAEAAASIRGHINERDLLEISAWNMLDWAPMDTPYHGVVTHQNMLAVWALRSAARLLNETGDEQEAIARMRSAADRTADAINKHLWDDENAAYVDAIHADGSPSTVHSVQTHLMGLLSGVVPEGRRSHVEALVEFPPESFVVIGSPFMSFFLFRHLSDRRRYSAVLTAIREGWGAMIEEGSTTCWETFRGFYTDRLTRSYCHAWSSAPAWYLPEVVLGIRRLAPAWREVEVKPHLGDLDWAEGSVVTPQGPIFVRWRKRTDGAVDLKVVAPPGVQVRS